MKSEDIGVVIAVYLSHGRCPKVHACIDKRFRRSDYKGLAYLRGGIVTINSSVALPYRFSSSFSAAMPIVLVAVWLATAQSGETAPLAQQKLASSTEQLNELRLLQQSGDGAGLRVFFRTHRIHDKEFYLAYAVYLYVERCFTDAIKQLELARTAPALLEDEQHANMLALYLQALCLNASLQDQPEPKLLGQTLAAWRLVKRAFRHQQKHFAYRAANAHIRRLSTQPD